MFLDKYKPTKLDDLYGNSIQIKTAIEWIKNYNKNEKKILLISGPPGIGKTSLSHILLKEHNYYPIEFNASEVRSQKVIEEKLSKIINQKSILMMFNNYNKPAIIMDEIDGCLSGDRGGIKQLIKMVYPKQKKKDKKKFKIHTPIICICNNDNIKNINELKKFSVFIKFKYPSKYHIIEYIKKICKLEKLILKENFYKYIYNHSQNDFRRILTILESLQIKYKKKPRIKKKYIKDVISLLDKKTINYSIHDSVTEILYNEDVDINNINNLMSSDIFMIPLLMHENFPYYLDQNCVESENKPKKLDILLDYYDKMIDYCKLEKNIFLNQNWEFNEYGSCLSCYNARDNFNKLEKTIYRKKNSVNYSSLLSKISQKFLNSKNYKLLVNKLNLSYNNFQDYSELILQTFIKDPNNDKDKDSYENVINKLKDLNLDKKDFNKFIKLNKYSSYWDKKINSKLKKQLINHIF